MTDTKLSISFASEADVALLYELTVALAVYEKKTPDQILVTAEKLRKWAFGNRKVFEALIARIEGVPAGMAIFYYGYSGYMGAPILYLEDLFVLPDFRGQGIATEVLRRLASLALEAECCRMQWAVFDWNVDAIGFYKSIAAELRPDLVQVRLNSEKLAEFANGRSHRQVTT